MCNFLTNIYNFLKQMSKHKLRFASALFVMISFTLGGRAVTKEEDIVTLVFDKKEKPKAARVLDLQDFYLKVHSKNSESAPIPSKLVLNSPAVLKNKRFAIYGDFSFGFAQSILYSNDHLFGSIFSSYWAPSISLQIINKWFGDWFLATAIGYERVNMNKVYFFSLYPNNFFNYTGVSLNKFKARAVIGKAAGANIFSLSIGPNIIPLIGANFKKITDDRTSILSGFGVELGYEHLLTSSLSLSLQLGYEFEAGLFPTKANINHAIGMRFGVSYKFGLSSGKNKQEGSYKNVQFEFPQYLKVKAAK